MGKINLEKRLIFNEWNREWEPMPQDSIKLCITQYGRGGKRYCIPEIPLDKNMDIEDVKKFLTEDACKLYGIDEPTTEVIIKMILDGNTWTRTIKYKLSEYASKESRNKKEVTTDKVVYIIDVDKLDDGDKNTKDFVGVSIPPGYTHVKTISQYTPDTIENPLTDKIKEEGGTWLCLLPSALKRVMDDPNAYLWVDGQPLPSSSEQVTCTDNKEGK